MISFYKKNIDYITTHAVDPDKRRYSNPDEAPRHYIDLDHYGATALDSVPHHWKDAVKKFTEDTLKAYGIVPWYIETMMYRLTEAFKDGNVDRILYLSANLGHYIEDAHVPLHTTENYNGQLTNQKGIHGFWESRIPELFADKWELFTGRAQFVDKINDRVWQIVKQSYQEKDSVLQFEAELSAKWSVDKKYVFDGGKKNYSEEYSVAYNKMLNGMVERRMRQSIADVGNFWYTAWVNAGEPNLERLMLKEVSDSLNTKEKETEKMWKTGKPPGHDEEE